MPTPSISSSKGFGLGMTVGTEKSQIRFGVICRITINVIDLQSQILTTPFGTLLTNFAFELSSYL